ARSHPLAVSRVALLVLFLRRGPPRATLFPSRRSSDLPGEHLGTISFGSQGLSTGPLHFLGVDNGAPREYWFNLFQWGDDLTYVRDRKSTRLNSSHVAISYAVFCLKKKKQGNPTQTVDV